MTFTIAFDDLNVAIPPACKVTVNQYSATDRGGFDSAELSVTGQPLALWQLLPWLGKTLAILNPIGRMVWRGMASELTLGFGGFAVGASLTDMANRIAVVYSVINPTGASIPMTTDWLDDLESQTLFGVKELRFSAGDASTEQALAKRAELLAGLAWPVGTPTLTPTANATVRCIGLYQTLDWKYFTNLNGRIRNEPSGGETISLGWRLTSTEIGFFRNEGVFHLGNTVDGLQAGDSIVVTGSASNNGARTVKQVDADEAEYSAATISFDPADDILDSADGFTSLDRSAFIQVTGSPANSGFHWVKNKPSNSQLEIRTTLSHPIVTEAAGPWITLRQGARIAVNESAYDELPGASVTLTLVGCVCAQSFVSPISMTAGKVALRLAKVGSPADSLSVSLCSDSAGVPGAVLGTGVLSSSYLDEQPAEIWIDLPPVVLSAGATYWLKVERTGAFSPIDYYELGLSDQPYHSAKGWNGSSWVSLTRDGSPLSIPFSLHDTEDASVSMSRIIDQCGQSFVTALDCAPTGVNRCQFTDNDATALQELNKLIDLGASGGQRLIALVDEQNRLTVSPEPTLAELSAPVLHQDGRLHDASGSRWDEGRLPVAQWVTLAGVPEDINSSWRISPIFVQSASYNVQRRKLNLTPRSARSALTFFRSG